MNSSDEVRQGESILELITDRPRLTVRYREAKTSPKGIIILVHGICHGAWCFENFMDFFSENGYECFALNLRGHGDNGRRGLTFAGLSGYAEDVKQCVEFCDSFYDKKERKPVDTKPFILGHSMGGAVVQKYIGKYPKTTKGAILFASATANRMKRMKTIIAGIQKKNLRLAVCKAFGINLSDEKLASSAFFDDRVPMEGIRRYNQLLHRESFRIVGMDLYIKYTKNREVGIPVLVIGSDVDAYFPADSLTATAEFYHTKPVILKGLCHDMMLDPEWEKPAREVLEFLDGCR